MLKEEIKYTDYNGDERTDVAYFNMTKLEAAKLNAKVGGDIEAYSKSLAASDNLEQMLTFMQDLILDAYGKKSEDGKKFVKSEAIKEDFANSAAFAQLFEDFLEHPEKAKDFGVGLAQQAASPKVNDKKEPASSPKLSPLN